jgi:hypothetical protein
MADGGVKYIPGDLQLAQFGVDIINRSGAEGGRPGKAYHGNC